MTAGLLCLATGCRFTDQTRDGDPGAKVPPTAPGIINQAPQIQGQPSSWAQVGEFYDFRPVASDPEGDPLSFVIAGKPDWAAFDAFTGRLSGTPPPGTSGRYDAIQITVSDGILTASLPAFSITVGDVAATGTATLRWAAPTQTSTGEPLTDLAGFRVYYGQSPDRLDQTRTVADRSATQTVIDNLSTGTWFFAVTAYTSAGAESVRSNVVSKGV